MADLIDIQIDTIPHPTMAGITLREARATLDLGDGRRTTICGIVPPEVVTPREISEWLLNNALVVNAPWPTDPNELL